MALEMDFKKDGSIIVVGVKGTLDAHNAPEFEKKMNEYLGKEKGSLIVDLSGVNHIASAGFGAFMPVKNIQDDRGHKMVLACLNDNVKKVFNLLGFNNVLQEYASIEDAKKAL